MLSACRFSGRFNATPRFIAFVLPAIDDFYASGRLMPLMMPQLPGSLDDAAAYQLPRLFALLSRLCQAPPGHRA